MKNIELAKLVYEMKPGDPPSLHKGENWYTLWGSFTVEEAWLEAESVGLIPDWEHDWTALKFLLFDTMKKYELTFSFDVLENDFWVGLRNYDTEYRAHAGTLEEAVYIAVCRALTELKK